MSEPLPDRNEREWLEGGPRNDDFPDLSFWRYDLLTAMEERAGDEMSALEPGHPDRIVWATVGCAAQTIREVREWKDGHAA